MTPREKDGLVILFVAIVFVVLTLIPGRVWAQETKAPPVPLPAGSTLVRYHDHPYFGDTWLVRMPDGYALAIPNRWHVWALSYYEGEFLAGVKNPVPAWLTAIETGQVEPGPRLPNP